MKKSWTLLFSILFVYFVSAATVSVFVSDCNTGVPIANARIHIYNQDRYTNSTGFAYFSSLNATPYIMYTSAYAYEPKQQAIYLQDGSNYFPVCLMPYGGSGDDITPPNISVSRSPTSVSAGENVTLYAHANDSSGIFWIEIKYSINGQSWQVQHCESASYCSVVLSALVEGDNVSYYAIAEDNSPNHNYAETDHQSFVVGPANGALNVSVSRSPSGVVTENDQITLATTASSPSALTLVEIDYRVNSSSLQGRSCTSSPCSVVIGPFSNGTSITYYGYAEDADGSSLYSEQHTFVVGKEGYGILKVHVSDASNNTAISGALVQVDDGSSAYTDSNGNVTFDSVLVGSRALNISKTGYQLYTTTVSVLQDQTTTLNVALTKEEARIYIEALNTKLYVEPGNKRCFDFVLHNTDSQSHNVDLVATGNFNPYSDPDNLTVAAYDSQPFKMCVTVPSDTSPSTYRYTIDALSDLNDDTSVVYLEVSGSSTQGKIILSSSDTSAEVNAGDKKCFSIKVENTDAHAREVQLVAQGDYDTTFSDSDFTVESGGSKTVDFCVDTPTSATDGVHSYDIVALSDLNEPQISLLLSVNSTNQYGEISFYALDFVKGAEPGDKKCFDLVVKNIDDQEHSVDFVTISSDFAATFDKTTLNVPAEESAQTEVCFEAPDDAEIKVYKATIQARSSLNDPELNLYLDLRSSENHPIVITTADATKDVRAGESQCFDLLVKNVGDRVTDVKLVAQGDYSFRFDKDTFSIENASSKEVQFCVDTPTTAVPITHQYTVDAISTYEDASQSLYLSVSNPNYPDAQEISVHAVDFTKKVILGNKECFDLMVDNRANTTKTVSLSVDGYYSPTLKDSALTIAAGDSGQTQICVDVPDSATTRIYTYAVNASAPGLGNATTKLYLDVITGGSLVFYTTFRDCKLISGSEESFDVNIYNALRDGNYHVNVGDVDAHLDPDVSPKALNDFKKDTNQTVQVTLNPIELSEGKHFVSLWIDENENRVFQQDLCFEYIAGAGKLNWQISDTSPTVKIGENKNISIELWIKSGHKNVFINSTTNFSKIDFSNYYTSLDANRPVTLTLTLAPNATLAAKSYPLTLSFYSDTKGNQKFNNFEGSTNITVNVLPKPQPPKTPSLQFVSVPDIYLTPNSKVRYKISVENKGDGDAKNVKLGFSNLISGITATSGSAFDIPLHSTKEFSVLFNVGDVKVGQYSFILKASGENSQASTSIKAVVKSLSSLIYLSKSLKYKDGKATAVFTVTNIGDKDISLSALIEGVPKNIDYQIEPSLITIAPHQSQNFTVTLSSRNSTSGNYSLSFVLKTGSEEVKRESFSVSGAQMSAATGMFSSFTSPNVLFSIIGIIILLAAGVAYYYFNQQNKKPAEKEPELSDTEL